jgi:hypothetical protein
MSDVRSQGQCRRDLEAPALPLMIHFGHEPPSAGAWPTVGSAGPRARHRERDGALGSFGQSCEAQAFRVLFHERGLLIGPEVFPEAGNAECRVNDLQAGG